jgi:hypothetical protein
MAVDVGQVFELPAGAARKFTLKSPWKEDAGRAAVTLEAGRAHAFQLQPFETLVLEGN